MSDDNLTPLEKARLAPRKPVPSRAKAIAAKCRDCIYDELERGTWREQVTGCTVRSCPLWEVRPTSTSARAAAWREG